MSRRKAKQSKNSKDIVLSPAAVSYSGPLRMPIPKNRPVKDDIVAQVNLIGTIASSGAGVIDTVFDCYTIASTSPAWAEYLQLYSEYRVLSMDVELVPWNKYNYSEAKTVAPVYSVEDRQNATALTSLNQASSYITLEAHEPSTKIHRASRMQGTGEADFTSSSSTPNSDDRFYIKLYSSGNTVSTTLYDYVARCMVQWRNRK